MGLDLPDQWTHEEIDSRFDITRAPAWDNLSNDQQVRLANGAELLKQVSHFLLDFSTQDPQPQIQNQYECLFHFVADVAPGE